MIHVAAGRDEASRLGIALTRKLVPSSVDRNFVKRLVRETFRRHPVKARGLDCVVMLRGRFERAQSAPMVAEIRGLFDRLCDAD